jgi:basic membrane protein A
VTFKEEEGSFLAGALAAMDDQDQDDRVLGGIDIPLLRKFEAGYAAGARQIDPSVKVLVKYVGSFDDPAAGKELAGVLLSIRAPTSSTSRRAKRVGAIDQVKTRRRLRDRRRLRSGRARTGEGLTSMVKRVDVGVYAIADAVAHKPRPAISCWA